MIETNVNLEPIHYQADELTAHHLSQFIQATRTQSANDFPLSFATLFRKAEFMWLERMNVDLRNLLHTDQEYEYFSPFQVGDIPLITTKLVQSRERKGMVFVTLATEIRVGDKPRVLATTTFVVRPPV